MLRWTEAEVRAVNALHGLYTDLPVQCRGTGCDWAGICPLVAGGTVEPHLGRECPLEIQEAFQCFVAYVTSLGIQPADYVDLTQVFDLVRIHIQLRRCDLDQKIHNLVGDQPRLVIQKTGEVVRGPEVTLSVETQSRLRKDRDTIYKQLLASREAKVKAEALSGRQKDNILKILSNFTKVARSEEPLDAEFTTEETPSDGSNETAGPSGPQGHDPGHPG